MGRELVFAAVTLAVCVSIAGVSLCRLRLTTTNVRRAVRVKYAALGAGALVFGVSPWVGVWSGWPGAVFAVTVLIGLLANSGRWQREAPPEARTDASPLE